MNMQDTQGGGFMRTAGDTFGGSDKPAGPINCCRPVTIKQLLTSPLDMGGEAILIDGSTPNQVTFVGRINTVKLQSTNANYTVEDGTGAIEVKVWIDEQSDTDAQKRSEWREGVSVRVVGSFRQFQDTRNVLAYNISIVTDFNEITYHILQVIHTHLMLTKNVTASPGAANVFGTATMGIQTNTSISAGAVYGQQIMRDTNDLGKPSRNDLFSAIQRATSPDDPQGVDIYEVFNMLQQQYSGNELREALDWLCNEGHLYSTIDDQHFKLTDEN